MWKDLTLSDKARMMALAVKSGVTDLRTIQEVYNTYATGGPKKSIVKDIAYRIAANDDVSSKGAATPKTILKSIFGKSPKMDDNKYAYVYGTGDRYPEVEEKIEGFDYTPYIKRSGYEGVKNVYGTINPKNEYHIDPEYKTLLTELAKNKHHFYDNADDMFLDSDPDVLGYRDDVANFIHQLEIDNNGNVITHDSDIYDFNPIDYNYAGDLPSWMVKTEAKLMNKIGTPYIIRQENQPIFFDGLTRGSQGIQEYLQTMPEHEIARFTNSTLLDPAFIVAEQ